MSILLGTCTAAVLYMRPAKEIHNTSIRLDLNAYARYYQEGGRYPKTRTRHTANPLIGSCDISSYFLPFPPIMSLSLILFMYGTRSF